jgi:hypothetical protein
VSAPGKADVYKTVVWSFVGAGVGMLVTSFAEFLYPPLGRDSQAFGHAFEFFFLNFIAVMWAQKLARYITFVNAICVLASASALILAAFVFLNGALDFHPTVQADALVSGKYVGGLRSGGPSLRLSIAWNQGRIEETVSVSRRAFSMAEPGDSVRVTIHPGLFSIPWYGSGVTLNGTATSDSTPDEH